MTVPQPIGDPSDAPPTSGAPESGFRVKHEGADDGYERDHEVRAALPTIPAPPRGLADPDSFETVVPRRHRLGRY